LPSGPQARTASTRFTATREDMIRSFTLSRRFSATQAGRDCSMRIRFCSLASLLIACVLLSCRHAPPSLVHKSGADSVAILNDNLAHRAAMDTFFREDPHSPFVRDTSVAYHGLRWFPVDPVYCVRSVLHTSSSPDTVIVMGTRGEERRQLRYGYFEFLLPGPKGRRRRSASTSINSRPLIAIGMKTFRKTFASGLPIRPQGAKHTRLAGTSMWETTHTMQRIPTPST